MINNVLEKLFLKKDLFKLDIKEDEINHDDYFNGSINQVNYLKDTNDIFIETEGLRKKGLGDSSDGRALTVDAHDFIHGYVVMTKNDDLEGIKWNLATLKVCKNET